MNFMSSNFSLLKNAQNNFLKITNHNFVGFVCVYICLCDTVKYPFPSLKYVRDGKKKKQKTEWHMHSYHACVNSLLFYCCKIDGS